MVDEVFISEVMGDVWCGNWSRVGTEIVVTTGDSKVVVFGNIKDNAESSTRSSNNKVEMNVSERYCKQFGVIQALESAHGGRTVRCASFSPCGLFLASVGFDAGTVIYKRDSVNNRFSIYATLESHENEIKCVAWSNSGKYLATCGRDKTVWVWEIINTEEMGNRMSNDSELEFECAAVLTAHTQDIKTIVWHPHQDIILSTSYDNSVKLFAPLPALGTDVDGEWDLICNLPNAHASTVWAADFNSDGTRFASVGADNMLKIHTQTMADTGSTKLAYHVEVQIKISTDTQTSHIRQCLYACAWNWQTNTIAVGGEDNAVHIIQYNLHDKSLSHISTYILGEYDINSLKWCPINPHLLAATTDQGRLHILSVLTI